jgi:hypothetical protein
MMNNYPNTTKDHLQKQALEHLTKSTVNKLDRCWRMTLLNNHSVEQLALATGAGTTTITRMRKTLRELQKYQKKDWFDLAWNLGWKEVQSLRPLDLPKDSTWERLAVIDLRKKAVTICGSQPEVIQRLFALAMLDYLNEGNGAYVEPAALS